MSGNCSECDENAICQNGYEVIVNAGFWRKSLNSTEIYSCPNPSSCLGGFFWDSEFPVACKEGYSKFLC